MKKISIAIMLAGSMLLAGSAGAAAVDELLQTYAGQGAGAADPGAANTLWTREFRPAGADQDRSCATCHTRNLRQTGKHAKTGKPIDAMAPSVNGKRLTDVKHIEKWFGRNCKWTLGRECSPQEKANFLAFIRGS